MDIEDMEDTDESVYLPINEMELQDLMLTLFDKLNEEEEEMNQGLAEDYENFEQAMLASQISQYYGEDNNNNDNDDDGCVPMETDD